MGFSLVMGGKMLRLECFIACIATVFIVEKALDLDLYPRSAVSVRA